MSTVDNLSSSLIKLEEQLQSLEQQISNGAGAASPQGNQGLWPSTGLFPQFGQFPYQQAPVMNGGTGAISQIPQELDQLLGANNGNAGPALGTQTFALNGDGATLPDAGAMPYYVQQGNSCGTTTLAEIMSYLGVPETQGSVDDAIRRWNTFTAPDDMLQFARDNGLSAEGYNNGTFDQVKSMIDAGHPVQALVNGDSSVSVNNGSANFSVNGLHYIAITGYGTDPATGEQYVTYHDPNRPTEQRMSVADFEKMWGNVPGGFHNYFNAYGPAGANLPPGNNDGIQSTQGVLSGVTNITNGLSRVFSPDNFGSFLHGIPEAAGGVIQTVGSGVGAILQLGAGWVNNAVSGIPVVQNIVQPVGDLVNGVGAAIGDVSNGFGEAANNVGQAFDNLGNGNVGGFFGSLGNAVGNVASGVGNAIGDAASSVGHAIGDFFSGW